MQLHAGLQDRPQQEGQVRPSLVRARPPGVYMFLCDAQVSEALSEQWYKLTQANQEAAGLVRLSRHKFISKVHAEQVMSEDFTARQNCDDRWLKLETMEGLW